MERVPLMTWVKLALALVPALLVALPAVGEHGALGFAAGLATGIAAAFVVTVLHLGRLQASIPLHVRTVGLRERARLANVVRLRDPDAPGRTRPRAPSSGSAAA